MPADPWLIIMHCTTQKQAELLVRVMREMGIEQPSAIVKRSEARQVLAENISTEPKKYNQAALNQMKEDERARIRGIQSNAPSRIRRTDTTGSRRNRII